MSRVLSLSSVVLALAFTIQSQSAEAQVGNLREAVVKNHLEFRPNGDGPFPTLIAFPGCSGIAFEDRVQEATHPALAEDDRLFRSHYLRISEQFAEAGYAVLLIHVHGAEGLVKACAGEISHARIAQYIDESVSWARGLDFVDSNRIHVIGWSMGGGGVLAWLHGTRPQADVVQSAIAVYPGCEGHEPLTSRVPLLMLLGGSDDIALPSVCEGLVAASGANAKIIVERYPGARHGFDITDAPSVLDIGNGMTVGYQKDAAEASWRRILAFLAEGP